VAAESKAGPEIASGLEDVLSRILQLQVELRNHPGNDRVAKATSAVLARIICFIVNAKRFVRKSGLSRAIRARSNKLSGILCEVARLDEARAREIRSAGDKGNARSTAVATAIQADSCDSRTGI